MPENLAGRLAVAANAADSPEEAFRHALEDIASTYGFELAHAYVKADPARGLLEPASLWRGVGDSRFRTFKDETERTRFENGHGLVGRVAERGRPEWLHTLRREEGFARAESAADEGIRTAFALPVLAGEEVVAVLEFFSREDRAPEVPLLEESAAIGAVLGRVVERRRAMAELEASNRSFWTLFDFLPVPMGLTLAESRRYVSVNRAFEEATGLKREEAIGRSSLELGIWREPLERDSFLERFRDGHFEGELEIRRVTGEVRTVLASARLIPWDEPHVLASFLDITDRKRAEAEARASQRRARGLLRQLLRAQEEERSRISNELHDQIGQALTVLQLNLSDLGSADGRATSALVGESLEILDRIMDEVRTLSFELRPTVFQELGLASALRSLATEYSGHDGLDVEVLAPEVQVSQEVGMACYRVAQEAVTNVLRHAGASRLELGLETQGEELVLTVSDDGRGFRLESDADASTSHLGLAIMTERAAAVEGRVEVASEPGEGTTVVAHFPLEVGR